MSLFVGSAAVMAGLWLGYRWWMGAPRPPPVPSQAPEPGKPRVLVNLYFADDQAELLVRETREVIEPQSDSALAQAVVEELIKGPRGGLQPTMPPGTALRSQVSCAEGVCTVDFTEQFVSAHPGGTSGELMTIYSVVESLRASVPGVKGVRFLVEGKTRDSLAGHVFLGGPVFSEPGLIRWEGAHSP